MPKLTLSEKKKLCSGCKDDYYNQGKGYTSRPGIDAVVTVDQCWLLKSAKVVRRWKLGWWTEPKSKDVFQAVTTLNCHNATGKYALMECLPQHLGGDKPPKEVKPKA